MDETLSRETLQRIANAARTLDESFGVEPTAGDQAGVASSKGGQIPDAWTAWQKAVAPEVPEAFGLRLGWDGFRPSRWLANRRTPSKDEEPPPWTEWLRRAGAAARELAGSDDVGLGLSMGVQLGSDLEPAPFKELWFPFLLIARETLEQRLGPDLREQLSPAAWREAERDLLGQTAVLAERAVFGAFETFRGRGEASGNPPGSRVNYRHFIHHLFADGLAAFFLEHAALARQVCRFTEDWVENTASLLVRLAADRGTLEQEFSRGNPLGPVATLSPGLSDRHHGGQQAAVLTFANGQRLVYKPKDLRQDAALGAWCDWFAARGLAGNVPPVARVVARGGEYGWAEFITPGSAETPGEVERYYRRAGVLLAFIHALGGNDCVMDNVIATGEGPVLIDVETLFQPRAATASDGSSGGGSLRGARQLVGDSVLRTGLLPTWQRTATGSLFDVSGLAGVGGEDTGYRQLVWRDVNSDAMRPEKETIRRPPQANLLRLTDGTVVPAREHLDALETGFRLAANAMIAHRTDLSGSGGLLRRLFAGGRTRFLLRPTYVYSVLLQSWSRPSAWRSGPARGMGFECLVRPFVQRAVPGLPPPLWPLLRRERQALERHDIPHFPIASDASDLVLAGSGREDGPGEIRVPGVFAESGLDAADARLRALSPEGVEAQVTFLRAAFHRPANGGDLAVITVPESRAELDATVPLRTDELLAWAGRLADQIAAAAVTSGEDAVVWFSPGGLRLDDEARRGGGLYLYDGNCGIALFLAADEAQSAERSPARRELIARACRPVMDMLESPGEKLAKGLGICVGVGAAVYTFVRIAGFLGDPAYLERAARAAAEITPERIAADRSFDLFHGTAGAIFSLLALHRATGEREFLETARRCGRHLVAHQRPAGAGGAGWTVVQGWMPVGLAHGTAGIALALARLGAAAGTEEFVEPVRRALRYERALYRPEALNWPVVNVPGGGVPPNPVFLNAWCNGAAGTGLSRLGIRDVFPTGEAGPAGEEIEVALRKNRLGGVPKVDFPCCGNFGRIEFLAAAGRSLGRPDLGLEAQRRAAVTVRRAEANGGVFSFGPDASDDRCFQPGFFRGLAGIGYGLLRLAKPENVPSVLLFG